MNGKVLIPLADQVAGSERSRRREGGARLGGGRTSWSRCQGPRGHRLRRTPMTSAHRSGTTGCPSSFRSRYRCTCRSPIMGIVRLPNAASEVEVDPARGGNLTSLVDRRTARQEFVVPELRQGTPAGYSASFHDAGISGWDEMTPTIDAVSYRRRPATLSCLTTVRSGRFPGRSSARTRAMSA